MSDTNQGEQRGLGQENVVKKRKFKTTGGRAIERTSKNRLLCEVNTNYILILIGLLILVGVVLAIVLLIQSTSLPSFGYFEKIACEQDSPSPIFINACLRSNCTFNVEVCAGECPFGYAVDENECDSSCECATEGTFEGDIYFTEDELPDLIATYGYSISGSDFDVYAGSASSSKIWDDDQKRGRHNIYYVMSKSVTSKAKSAIREAISRFRKQTCIDFTERTNQKRYFQFVNGGGCSSMIGKFKRNGQQVSIGEGCEIPGVVQHELLHLLGFYHEHSRPDRDSYLQVLTENIVKKRLGNFKKRTKTQVRDLESEYDLRSILHYPSIAFSSNGKPSILSRADGQMIRAQRDAFTKEDLYEVNVLYKCLEFDENAAKWSEWAPWSECDETCGVGEKVRFRKCLDYDGSFVSGCKGSRFNKLACHASPCPAKSGRWSNWGEVTKCSQSCSGGYQFRKRKCTPHGQCDGVSYQGKSCNKQPCTGPGWTQWTNWTPCSANCGKGETMRRRQCLTLKGGVAHSCERHDFTVGNEEIEKSACGMQSCRPRSDVINWEYSGCSATCDGIRIKNAPCFKEPCRNETITEPCNVGLCNKPRLFEVEPVQPFKTTHLCDATDINLWMFGDFNGDHEMDILCPDTSGLYKLHLANHAGEITWTGAIPECEKSDRIIADFNGDGKDDILCRNARERCLYVKYATEIGFTSSRIEAGSFCTNSPSDRLILHSSTKDRVSIACHFENKAVEIRYIDLT